jgi:Ca2+-transporting ATPase
MGAPLIDRLPRPIRTLFRAIQLYVLIGGEQRAAAFAYYALFSIVPLAALILSIGSFFFDSSDILSAIENFAPITEAQRRLIFSSVENLERVRGSVSALSITVLIWTALRFFQALVLAVNEAWRTAAIPWWQVPLKSLFMIAVIGTALVLGIVIPAIIQVVRQLAESLEHILSVTVPQVDLAAIFAVLDWSRYLVSAIVLFYAFAMLYRFAPRRRLNVRFSQVWLPALVVSIFLQVVQVGFVNLLPRFINYSEIYGSISSLMLLLLWIYVTGQIIIIGACLCASDAQSPDDPGDPLIPSNSER